MRSRPVLVAAIVLALLLAVFWFVNAGARPHNEVQPQPDKGTFVVTHVVDGDTVDLDNGETVRLVGIDTPERGECGYAEARAALVKLVEDKAITLDASDEDRDRYDRLLRYVDVRGGKKKVDAGLQLIKDGLAIARYDSRDGYGRHPREDRYVRADKASPPAHCG